MRELTALEKKIINEVSRGIDAVSRPYERIAAKVGCGEAEVIAVLERLLTERRIRRVCAVLRQGKLGYAANAMCVFDVPDENVDAAGEFAAGLDEVSHCYKRVRADGWPYNLYAMIHSRSTAGCASAAAAIAGRAGARDYKLLFSVKEFKKENMVYFNDARISSGASGAAVPRLIAWEMSAACNLDCVHCRAAASAGRRADELSFDECRSFLDDIAALEPAPVLIMTGGEPLMRPDFFAVLEYAHGIGVKTVLATNATLIDAACASRLAANGISVASVSIDGATAAAHDSFRRTPGSFDESVRGIEFLKAAGVRVQINVSVTRRNYSDIENIFATAVGLGASAIHIFLLVPTGRAENLRGEEISPAEYERLLNWFYDKKREYGGKINLKATCAPHYYRIMRERAKAEGVAVTPENFGADALSRGCLAGCGFAFVSSTGAVQGCGYMPVAAGSVRERKFSEIYANSEFFNKLRDFSLLKGKCGRCGYKKVCGGCRARALAATGDCFEEEPYCNYEPGPAAVPSGGE